VGELPLLQRREHSQNFALLTEFSETNHLLIGKDSIDRLGDLSEARLTVVISGQQSYQISGVRDALRRIVKGDFVELTGTIDPTISDVERLAAELNRISPERIIAVGGGSILDLAKASRHTGQVKAPLIAIPTTAGSGSEATPYASIRVKDERSRSGYKKISFSDPTLIPSIVCLNPGVIATVPKVQRAISGMDVIVQSVESYWSKFRTPDSVDAALRSIRLWAENFPQYLADVSDDCQAVQLAAFYSGRAIAQAPTTACHAISYPLTTDFNIPHGWAVVLTFREVLSWNSDALIDRRAELCAAFGVASLDDISERLGHLMQGTGIPTRLSEWGISAGDIPYLVERGYRPDRMNGTPRAISPEDLETMLGRLL
jgi:alcohol dehydrogenase class IV